MKKRFAISALMVLILLIVSQTIWIRQVAERDKSRFEAEVSTSINNIVKYQATKQSFTLFGADSHSPKITLERVHPDSTHSNKKIYGNLEKINHDKELSLSNFLEGAIIERLFYKNKLDLPAIDSIFKINFPYTSELSAYTFQMQEKGTSIDSLYFGINAIQQLNDTTKGVYISIPLGTSGNYRFVSHFIFRPTTAIQRMKNLVILSSVAVMAVAIILFILVYQLQQQMRRLQFQEKRTRGIIHDLKSPLSYIYSMLGVLEMDGENDFLTEGKLRVKQLSNNIERMLSEVKLNKKKNTALQREPYDLARHCREISADLEVIHANKNIAMTYHIASEARNIHVDAFYFDSCLRNLLENAIKYSGDSPAITITAKREKENILIGVADNGPGIPKKEQSEVFRDFYRSPRQSSEKGDGIGLSSVRQIVKAHGGSIQLESEEGKGSVFTIILPDKQ
ncbi:HAMP domain-containing sensor histidine kinase [Proteiniphilum sp.]|uniref:sensor histidine kinase n=1 Tax=Proteiniphilum sp. TaxID=1926877 RepID=UPI0033250200